MVKCLDHRLRNIIVVVVKCLDHRLRNITVVVVNCVRKQIDSWVNRLKYALTECLRTFVLRKILMALGKCLETQVNIYSSVNL